MRWSTVLIAAGAAAACAAAVVKGVRVRAVFQEVGTHAAYWRERADAAGELLYVALGDSTAQGVGAARPEEGYVGRLADDLAADTGRTVRVVNLAVSGARVADLVRDQLPDFTKLLAENPSPALVTVTIGANDTGRTEPADFEADIGPLIDVLPADARVADVPYFRGGRRGAAAECFSEVIRHLVAERPDLVQVDLWAVTSGLRRREYAADLFHPNALGYDRYYRAFRR